MKQIIFTTILTLAFCFAAFAHAAENKCPEISFDLPNQMIFPDEPVIFSVKVGENTEKYNLTYEWTFSRGKILKGDGTSQVEFLATEEDERTNVEVSVKIVGLPENCADTYSDIYGIASLPIGDPVATLGKPKPTRKGVENYLSQIDGFMISVKDYPNSEGLITLLFEKKDSRNYKTSLLKKIYKHLIFREFDLTQITFAISEGDFEEQTNLWVVPPEAKFPKYVLDENYKIIKAEEFNQKINELFPKK